MTCQTPQRRKQPIGAIGAGIALLLTGLPILSIAQSTSPITPVTKAYSERTDGTELRVLSVEIAVGHLLHAADSWWCLSVDNDSVFQNWVLPSSQCASRSDPADISPPGDASDRMAWFALDRNGQSYDLGLSLRTSSRPQTATIRVHIDPSLATIADASIITRWKEERDNFLQDQAALLFDSQTGGRRFDSASAVGLIGDWLRLGLRQSNPESTIQMPDSPAPDLSAWSLLSGGAAIQETLQLQGLAIEYDRDAGLPEVPISNLSGPDAPAHPFAELLGNRPGGRISIADWIPDDHWMLYISEPSQALPQMQQLAQTMASVRTLGQSGQFEYQLVPKYLARLGLSVSLIERFAPIVQKAALFGPDLFFAEGTHLSLVAELTDGAWNEVILQLFGLNDDGIVQRFGPNRNAFVARIDRYLIFSTSKAEIDQALRLGTQPAPGSLGQSVELRYMSAQLPPPEQGMYLYLSDPFIREMTGPVRKIGQWRRAKAEAMLRTLSAASLLFQSERNESPTIEQLVQTQYIDRDWLNDDALDLSDNARATSQRYGHLQDMTPIDDLLIDRVSQLEADAYQAYVDNYNRFWRATFDPIAISMSFAQTLEIESFILPLIGNSIYDQLRASLDEHPEDLSTPAISPAPVAKVSLQLRGSMLRDLNAEPWFQSAGLPDVSDVLTGAFHVAVFDDEPIITIGTANLLGGFSGAFLGQGQSHLPIGISTLATLLTQPAAVILELQPGANVEQFLDSIMRLPFSNFVDTNLARYGKNGWVWSVNIERLFQYNLYLRQVNDFLVISNRESPITMGTEDREEALANARLEFNFHAIDKLGASLYLSQMNHQAAIWRSALGEILPMAWSGATSAEDALNRYASVFGRRPKLPDVYVNDVVRNGLWPQSLDSVGELHYPDYRTARQSGAGSSAFGTIQSIDATFQLVADGVRIKLTVDSQN